MSDNEFGFNIDDILAEFGGAPLHAPAEEQRTDYAPEPVYEPEEPQIDYTPEPVYEPAAPEEPESVYAPEPVYIPEEPEPVYEEIREPEEPKQKKRKVAREPEPASKKKPAKGKKTDREEPPKKKESQGKRLGYGVLSLVFAVVSLAALAVGLQILHPETSSPEAVKASNSTDIVSRLESNVNNSKADALSNITFIPKHYTIPEGDTVAPAPNPSAFGTVSIDRAEEILSVIQKARDSGLLDGQEVVFDPTVEFFEESDIQYYCDDTILVICWKELINNTVCSCVEVKIADASQFRRKFVDDTFGSPVKLFATALAKSTNAVVAMNADFYMFRDFGIVAYQRQLYRFADTNYAGQYQKYNCTDTLFVDGSGNFHFFHRLEQSSWDEMQKYIDDNDIIFSVAFGPVLIENGELQECTWYPAGEWNTGYSRAGIGQFDDLHYFYMNVNHENGRPARWTVNEFGQHMLEKGMVQAYNLDGGQTGEIVFQGVPYNHIDFGAEREVSDIIYFATAIPESEVTP